MTNMFLRANRIVLLFSAIAAQCACAGEPEQLTRLRAEVAALVAPEIIGDADLRVKIAQSVFTKATGIVTGNGPRTFTFQGSGKTGYVWNAGGGFAGCGGFAEINDGGRAFSFAVTLHGLQATWQPDGRMAAKVDLGVAASGNVHGHIHGPAGMCEGPSFTYPMGRWSCDCKVGGGAGSNAGFTAQERRTFDGYLAFSPLPDGNLSYGLFLVSPREIPVTVKVGLQQIGNLGIPITIGVPNGRIAGGKWSALVQTHGKTMVGARERNYQLGLRDLKVVPDATGLDLRARIAFALDPDTRVSANE